MNTENPAMNRRFNNSNPFLSKRKHALGLKFSGWGLFVLAFVLPLTNVWAFSYSNVSATDSNGCVNQNDTVTVKFTISTGATSLYYAIGFSNTSETGFCAASESSVTPPNDIVWVLGTCTSNGGTLSNPSGTNVSASVNVTAPAGPFTNVIIVASDWNNNPCTTNPGNGGNLRCGMCSTSISYCNTPTATFTPTSAKTSTPTITPTKSVTPTPTITPTPSFTPSATTDPSFTITNTPTPTITLTPTITPSKTPTPVYTNTITLSPTVSLSPTITKTWTATSVLTPTYTVTPTFTVSSTYTYTFTPSFTPTPTTTPSQTITNTPVPAIPTATYSFTITLTPTITLTFTNTFTPIPTGTPITTYTPCPSTCNCSTLKANGQDTTNVYGPNYCISNAVSLLLDTNVFGMPLEQVQSISDSVGNNSGSLLQVASSRRLPTNPTCIIFRAT